MHLSSDKEDKIYNALAVGMALEDAYVYAGLTADEIEQIVDDHEHQHLYSQLVRTFEFGLLNRLDEISRKQTKMGKESATTWMLEKMFLRYSGKPQDDSGAVHLHFSNKDPATYDTVTISRGNETDNGVDISEEQ